MVNRLPKDLSVVERPGRKNHVPGALARPDLIGREFEIGPCRFWEILAQNYLSSQVSQVSRLDRSTPRRQILLGLITKTSTSTLLQHPRSPRLGALYLEIQQTWRLVCPCRGSQASTPATVYDARADQQPSPSQTPTEPDGFPNHTSPKSSWARNGGRSGPKSYRMERSPMSGTSWSNVVLSRTSQGSSLSPMEQR